MGGELPSPFAAPRPQERQHPWAAGRSRKLQTGDKGGGAAALGVRSSGAPRNDLERLLQAVAPQGEVLIAISNSNLLHGGELPMWIDVSGAGGWAAASCAGRRVRLISVELADTQGAGCRQVV